MNEHRESSCAGFRDDLLLRSSGELDADRSRALETHLESCSSCAALAADYERVAASYRDVVEEPVDEGRWRQAIERARPEKVTAERAAAPWLRAAAALVIFGAGAWVGGAVVSDRGQLGRLEDRLTNLETSVLVSRLRPASSAERLSALAALDSRRELPAEAWSALLLALDSDPSPNVRLGVVDALRRLERIEPATETLATLLLTQDSEIITAELIELAVDRDLDELRGVLARLAEGSPSSQVREMAAWALETLDGSEA